MFNKRGIGHEIDWILGVGLFLLSVTFIFVLFKPGITPVYDSQTLLDILQDGFEKDVYWTITKVPFFLTPANEYRGTVNVFLDDKSLVLDEDTEPGEDYYDRITNIIEDLENPEEAYIKVFYVGGGGSLSDVEETSNVESFCSTYEDLDLNFCDAPGEGPSGVPPGQARRVENVEEARTALSMYSSDIADVERENQIKYSITDIDSLIIPANFQSGVEKLNYIITVADRPINFEEPETLEPYTNGCYVVGELELNEPLFYDANPETGEVECPILYELGIEEKISGIDLSLFLALNTVGYEELKELWGFPSSKEFNITIESIPEGTDDTQISKSFGAFEPPQNVNVFARNFNSFILTDDGTKIPAKVTIKIW